MTLSKAERDAKGKKVSPITAAKVAKEQRVWLDTTDPAEPKVTVRCPRCGREATAYLHAPGVGRGNKANFATREARRQLAVHLAEDQCQRADTTKPS